jgi:hypothetical protein
MSVVFVSLYFPVWFWGVDGVLAGLMQLLAVNLVQVIVAIGFAHAALAPDTPDWRITPFTDAAASSLFRAVTSFALVVTVSAIVLRLPISYGPDLSALIGFVAASVTALFLIALLREQNWQFVETETPRVGAFVGARLRQGALILSLLAPLISLSGFGRVLRRCLPCAHHCSRSCRSGLGLGTKRRICHRPYGPTDRRRHQ